MPVRVVYLGRLRDLAGADSGEFPAPLDWATLLARLPSPLAVEAADPRVRVACAGQLMSDRTALRALDGQEVALLPPVSGG